jgi:hypothetical protein
MKRKGYIVFYSLLLIILRLENNLAYAEKFELVNLVNISLICINFKYQGNQIRSIDEDSNEKCARSCLKDSKCNYFSYFNGDKKCFLLTHYITNCIQNSNAAESGFLTRENYFSEFNYLLTAQHNEFKIVEKGKNIKVSCLEECLVQCKRLNSNQNLKICESILFDLDSKLCKITSHHLIDNEGLKFEKRDQKFFIYARQNKSMRFFYKIYLFFFIQKNIKM